MFKFWLLKKGEVYEVELTEGINTHKEALKFIKRYAKAHGCKVNKDYEYKTNKNKNLPNKQVFIFICFIKKMLAIIFILC